MLFFSNSADTETGKRDIVKNIVLCKVPDLVCSSRLNECVQKKHSGQTVGRLPKESIRPTRMRPSDQKQSQPQSSNNVARSPSGLSGIHQHVMLVWDRGCVCMVRRWRYSYYLHDFTTELPVGSGRTRHRATGVSVGTNEETFRPRRGSAARGLAGVRVSA